MPHHRNISVTGLGYVGLTMAVAFSQLGRVIAFDVSSKRIEELKQSIDRNEELESSDINSGDILYTCNPEDLAQANFHILSVPTPLDKHNKPDLSILLSATQMIGNILKPGDIVVYESTVYPGATEEECIPVLEQYSGLKYGLDFTAGFSPERINPSDKDHLFSNIIKIVSGTDGPTLEVISEVYKSVVKPGVYPVSNIRTAEATKIIENTQRDVNIAFINDISMMLHRMNIDTEEVIKAMKTKWNHIHQ